MKFLLLPLVPITKFWSLLKASWQWAFHRLPPTFSLSFIMLYLLYFAFAFRFLVLSCLPWVTDLPLNLSRRTPVLEEAVSNQWLDQTARIFAAVISALFSVLFPIISALLTISAAVLGLFFSYWIAGIIYSYERRYSARRVVAPEPKPRLPRCTSDEDIDTDNPLAPFKRIGIILSGGGAKGAYQAGAMQAIYEFLEKYNAHHRVKMIAGTSIGSWNALFWLGGLMKPAEGELKSPLQTWWEQVQVENVIQPARYIPMRQNYFLSNQPWKESFDLFFGNDSNPSPAGQRLLHHAYNNSDDVMHFYFTRTNIKRATLAFTTNSPKWIHSSLNLEHIRNAVFSSMDLPPLFQYMHVDNEICEDGGVVDNLPIRFGTEDDNCDLLFVLPLNATFEEEVHERSVIRRLARVMNIRQGVLERNSFKMVYLFNELACLRKKLVLAEERIASLETELASTGKPLADIVSAQPSKGIEEVKERIAERARRRTHEITHVFSICPAPELLINTTQFWKTHEAKKAFTNMYEVTRKQLLKHFTQIVMSKRVRMLKVHPDNAVIPFSDF